MNIYFSIWTHPKRTAKEFLSAKSKYIIFLLAILGGIVEELDKGEVTRLIFGEQKFIAFPFSAIITGVLVGIIGIYFIGICLFSYLFKWTGSLIDGKGEIREVRLAMALAIVPTIYISMLNLLYHISLSSLIALFNNPKIALMSAVIIVTLRTILNIWSFILSVIFIGAAHKISFIKSLISIVVAGLIILVLFLTCTYIFLLIKKVL